MPLKLLKCLQHFLFQSEFKKVLYSILHTLKCVWFHSIQISELKLCLNTESKIDIWKIRTIYPVFSTILNGFQRSCVTFCDGKLTFKWLSIITKIQTLRTQICNTIDLWRNTTLCHYNAKSSRCYGWESFYSKNVRVWTILTAWWLG